MGSVKQQGSKLGCGLLLYELSLLAFLRTKSGRADPPMAEARFLTLQTEPCCKREISGENE